MHGSPLFSAHGLGPGLRFDGGGDTTTFGYVLIATLIALGLSIPCCTGIQVIVFQRTQRIGWSSILCVFQVILTFFCILLVCDASRLGWMDTAYRLLVFGFPAALIVSSVIFTPLIQMMQKKRYGSWVWRRPVLKALGLNMVVLLFLTGALYLRIEALLAHAN